MKPIWSILVSASSISWHHFLASFSDMMPGHGGYQSMRHPAGALGETSRWIAVDAVPRRWDPMSSPPWSRRSRVGTVGRGAGWAHIHYIAWASNACKYTFGMSWDLIPICLKFVSTCIIFYSYDSCHRFIVFLLLQLKHAKTYTIE